MTNLEWLTALIKEHYGTKYRKVLSCAADVWEEVKAASHEAKPVPPGMPDLERLLGIEVHVEPDYAPGRWKMVRHDHCAVIGGERPEDSRIVTHRECTVLGKS